MTALALMGLLPEAVSNITQGSIVFDGKDLTHASTETLNELRGNDLSMIFQEPMTSLNPVFTIGEQIAEVLRHHENLPHAEALQQATELLDQVRIPEARRRVHSYPHELSGGQRQRVMIAMSLACKPRLLIADEPTTALDVTVQAQIFDLLDELQKQHNTAILLITHDMGVVAEMASRMVVMYAGRKVEDGPVDAVLAKPEHPYTKGLIACVPHLQASVTSERKPLTEVPGVVPALSQFGRDRRPGTQRRLLASGKCQSSSMTDPLLCVENLKVRFDLGRGLPWSPMRFLHAVDDVSFTIQPGETLGLVGESGSGKSTTALAVARLIDSWQGRVTLNGTDFLSLDKEALRQARANIQFIFQDPYSSLNPRLTAERIVVEPLQQLSTLSKQEQTAQVDEIFEAVGLRPEQKKLFPHQFSGGQRQRIGIARALICKPQLIICDEPVSALDVAVQAQILNLLSELQTRYQLTYLFISHDLGVVQHMCDRIAVMYMGRIVEFASRKALFTHPQHPYTQALLSAVPSVDRKRRERVQRIVLSGDPPDPLNPVAGCHFADRCPRVDSGIGCRETYPVMTRIDDGANGLHQAACHHLTQNPKG